MFKAAKLSQDLSVTKSCFEYSIWILSVMHTASHHHHHPSLNREGRLGTTDDLATSFLHFSLFSTALWDLPNSRPVHSLCCLPTSSSETSILPQSATGWGGGWGGLFFSIYALKRKEKKKHQKWGKTIRAHCSFLGLQLGQSGFHSIPRGFDLPHQPLQQGNQLSGWTRSRMTFLCRSYDRHQPGCYSDLNGKWLQSGWHAWRTSNKKLLRRLVHNWQGSCNNQSCRSVANGHASMPWASHQTWWICWREWSMLVQSLVPRAMQGFKCCRSLVTPFVVPLPV